MPIRVSGNAFIDSSAPVIWTITPSREILSAVTALIVVFVAALGPATISNIQSGLGIALL